MTCKNCIHFEMCLKKCGKSKAFAETVDEEYFSHADKCDYFKDKSRYIELPCKVGDTVYCDISNVRDGNFLDECIIQSIEFDRDFHEPLFTAICREKAEYQTYWTSDFGKTIFHEPHFAADKKRKKGKK